MEDKKQIQFNIEPEIGKGTYANLALITHSTAEFVLDFASLLPGMQKANVVSRVVLAPEHAKRLLMALQDNVFKYEQQFGKIQIPGAPQGRTIAPFGTGNGKDEA